MLTAKTTGRMSRTTGDDPSGQQSDDGDCVVCGEPADGLDAARDGNPPVCTMCAKIRTDGGADRFDARVEEMVSEIEHRVEDSIPAEAYLYARCSAAFEDAVNDTDLPPENALGVMTAALFEAADVSDIPRQHLIESAREHYVDQEVTER